MGSDCVLVWLAGVVFEKGEFFVCVSQPQLTFTFSRLSFALRSVLAAHPLESSRCDSI